MSELYPLGTVVSLKRGQRKLMITSRVPLMNENGTIEYFDYGGCLVPDGQNGNQMFFFNNEDIAEVYQLGYQGPEEDDYQEQFKKAKDSIPYPRFKLE